MLLLGSIYHQKCINLALCSLYADISLLYITRHLNKLITLILKIYVISKHTCIVQYQMQLCEIFREAFELQKMTSFILSFYGNCNGSYIVSLNKTSLYIIVIWLFFSGHKNRMILYSSFLPLP